MSPPSLYQRRYTTLSLSPPPRQHPLHVTLVHTTTHSHLHSPHHKSVAHNTCSHSPTPPTCYILSVQLYHKLSTCLFQTADFTLIAIFKWAGWVELYPHPGWTTVDTAGDNNTPFDDAIIISVGFVIILATTIPFGFLNLSDNIYVQTG